MAGNGKRYTEKQIITAEVIRRQVSASRGLKPRASARLLGRRTPEEYARTLTNYISLQGMASRNVAALG